MAWLEFWFFFLFFFFSMSPGPPRPLMQILILFLLYTYRYTRHIWGHSLSLLGSDVCYGILLALFLSIFLLFSCILLGKTALEGLVVCFSYRCVCYIMDLLFAFFFDMIPMSMDGISSHFLLVNQQFIQSNKKWKYISTRIANGVA